MDLAVLLLIYCLVTCLYYTIVTNLALSMCSNYGFLESEDQYK